MSAKAAHADLAVPDELLRLIARHLPGVVVWAFGSRVAGSARRYSDLDLVAFTTPEQAGRVQELREALEESSVPFIVDLHVWDELPETFRTEIERAHTHLAP